MREALDKAAAVAEYARRSREKALEMRAAEYRVYCERRLGEFSAEAAANGHKGGRPEKTSAEPTEVSRSAVAEQAGVDESTLRRKHEPLAYIPDADFALAVERCKENDEPPTAARVKASLNSTRGVGNEGADEWNSLTRVLNLVATTRSLRGRACSVRAPVEQNFAANGGSRVVNVTPKSYHDDCVSGLVGSRHDAQEAGESCSRAGPW